MSIDKALLQSYLDAAYLVQASPPFVLRIGDKAEALALCMQQEGVSRAAFITACNPASQLLPAGENAARQQGLQEELQRLGLRWLPGRGDDPAGEWPGEDSFLVLGIQKETACGLGRQFGQNAIVFCDSDAVPQLVLL